VAIVTGEKEPRDVDQDSIREMSTEMSGLLEEQSKLLRPLTHCRVYTHPKEIGLARFRVFGSRVLGANMGCKLFVALRLEDLLHFS
jgi:hypothetical protein